MEALTLPTPTDLATVESPDDLWDGALALAKAIDALVERPGLPCAQRFVASLNAIGVDGEAVLRGLLDTGLIEQDEDRLVFSQLGRLVVMHATSVL